MIRVNLMEMPAGLVVRKSQKSSMSLLPMLAGLFLALLIGAGAWYFYVGIPAHVLAVLPKSVQEFLPGVSSVQLPDPAPTIAEGAVVPVDGAKARPSLVRPRMVSDAAVEEIVRTLRPDLEVERKAPTTYRELLPAERILQQKALLREGFARFRKTTASVGFTDLAFRIPDLFYARGLIADPKVLQSFTDSLKANVAVFNSKPVPESGSGGVFTYYGRLRLPPPQVGEKLALLSAAEVMQEIEQIREMARAFQVRLTGLDKPVISDQGLYRRYLVHGQSRADFPTIARFAEAFASSSLRVGILQVGMRPTADEGLQTTFDFVLYSSN